MLSSTHPLARLCWALGSLLLLASAGLSQEAPTQSYPDGVVGIVDGVPITRYELELACQLRGDYRELTPGGTAQRKILHEELEGLVQQRILVNKARTEKVKFDEGDQKRLDLELARHAQRYGGGEGLKRALGQIGVPYDYFVARQKANVLVSKLLVKSVPRDIFITPSEIRRYYKRNRQRYNRKGVTRLRQIVVYPDPKSAVREAPATKAWQGEWDGKAYAESLRARVLAGEAFSKVSVDGSMGIKHDEEVVVQSGGSLDAVFIRPLGTAIEALRPGQMSEVVKTVQGTYYVVQLVDRRLPGPLPLEEVQKQIQLELKEATWQKKLAAWIEGLRKSATIRTFLPK
jgi:hypothetical protein